MTFVRFGMIVTGKGERDFLPKLFRAISAHANCTFEVIRKSEQLKPITSEKRLLKLKGKRIPSIDEEQFGLPAHGYLQKHENGYVLVIDDLEEPADAGAKFRRYRAGLDSVLRNQERSKRAAVCFLVNMLEAYYFAHASCVNQIAAKVILPSDYAGDVESIRHPKNDLKQKWQGFHEVAHGAKIVERLDLDHILENPDHCRWLRAMFAWCVDRLSESDSVWDCNLGKRFQLADGQRESLVRKQGESD